MFMFWVFNPKSPHVLHKNQVLWTCSIEQIINTYTSFYLRYFDPRYSLFSTLIPSINSCHMAQWFVDSNFISISAFLESLMKPVDSSKWVFNNLRPQKTPVFNNVYLAADKIFNPSLLKYYIFKNFHHKILNIVSDIVHYM